MSLEIFYPQDAIRILNALASAGELQGPEYHKALHDVALAFGVNLASIELRLPWRIVDAEAEVIGGPNPK